jgi:hypothetical protein
LVKFGKTSYPSKTQKKSQNKPRGNFPDKPRAFLLSFFFFLSFSGT